PLDEHPAGPPCERLLSMEDEPEEPSHREDDAPGLDGVTRRDPFAKRLVAADRAVREDLRPLALGGAVRPVRALRGGGPLEGRGAPGERDGHRRSLARGPYVLDQARGGERLAVRHGCLRAGDRGGVEAPDELTETGIRRLAPEPARREVRPGVGDE